MKEKLTRLVIFDPKLSRTELLTKIGFPPHQANFFSIRFNNRTITNRCPPSLTDELKATIKPNASDKWKFEQGAGVLYQYVLSKLAKSYGFSSVSFNRRGMVKWIQITSEVKDYLDHEKKVELFAKRLAKQGIVTIPKVCSQVSDDFVCPDEKDWFKTIHAEKYLENT